jgi:hypothetical protein
MYIHLPLGFWISVLGADVFIVGFILWSLARGASAAGLTPDARTRLISYVSFLLAGWGALDLVLASKGVFYYGGQSPFPFLAAGIAFPLLAGALLLLRSRALQAAVAAIPQSRLIGVQGVRVVGVMFLILLAQHRLPAIFALPAGIGDILVGLGALVLARQFATGHPSRRAAILWNVGGILDLAIAVGIGFLASSTPYRLIYSTPSTDIMTLLPMVMIPVFGIPLFLLEHGLSLARLTRLTHLTPAPSPIG